MPAPLLATKLYRPSPRPGAVLRRHLLERLDEGLQRSLTLLSAPAGFGKTTLVSEWAAGCGRPLAWLSLDEGDDAPARFLIYLIAALQAVDRQIGAEVLAALHTPQPPPPESLLTALLNEIAALPDRFVLVLDDYHRIESQPVDQLLAFLVEHQPPQLHLAIATREDPPLPLARLRARGQLTELRAADLRFTPAEAADFLNRMMGLQLADADVAALEARTEGWIAGLQLAALSMQGRSDTAGFIRAFTGSHRFVLDYLAGEVLERQPPRVREFLLQTAILDRLCGALCDAVTAQDGGRQLLETLERDNLFVVPLDDQRQWYRYHHLFADALQARLLEAHPEQVSGLHRRASVWHEQNGSPPDAIRHALAAGDFARAAGLIERAWTAMDQSYQSSTWLGWVQALPDALVRERPALSAGYAWALLDAGALEPSEARLLDAERGLERPAGQGVAADQEQYRSLPASIALARAYRSLALGDVPGAVDSAQQSLDLTPAGDQVTRIQAASLLGLARYANGELETAESTLAGPHVELQKSGEVLALIGMTFLLADIRVARGRLREAERCYRQSLRLVAGQGERAPLGTVDLHRGLAELDLERGDLAAAAQRLLAGQRLGERLAPADWPYRLCLSRARLSEAQGDLEGALALLDEAERVHIRSPLPDLRPVAALKARLWLRQGRLAEAQKWAREQGLSVDDDMRFTREFEHMTLARVLIAAAQGDAAARCLDDAARLLARLLQAAEAGGRMGSAIQILLLQAQALQAQGHLPRARAALERALSLAEPEGYVRTFVDEGEVLRPLLDRLSHSPDRRQSGYLDTLLAAFSPPAAAPKPAAIAQQPGLIEPLSEREMEVLRLLRSELSGPEIAEQLVVSLNTLRTHTQHIFNKLGVNNRRAAVRRAEELGLL